MQINSSIWHLFATQNNKIDEKTHYKITNKLQNTKKKITQQKKRREVKKHSNHCTDSELIDLFYFCYLKNMISL